MLKAAIIGCGNIATVHKRVLENLPEASLVACCDINLEKARKFAEDIGINAYENVTELLKKEKPDVVHLCVPHPLHTPIAKMCIESNAHVFTEKPPVVDYEQLDSLYRLKDTGRYIGVCFQNRYNSSVRTARGLITTGKIGKVVGSRAFLTWNREKDYYTQSDWRGKWDTEGGGVLINQAIHTLDLLVYLLGPAKDVACHMSNHSLQKIIEVEDTTEAFITFEQGAKACFYATNAYCYSAPVFVEIASEKAILQIEGNNLTIQWANGRTEKIENDVIPRFEKDYWGNSHYDCIRDFYRAIIENRPYSNDIENVKDTMDLMLKMYTPYRDKKIPDR